MISRRILAAVALLCAFAMPAHAQRTKAQLNSEIGVQFPDNNQGQITPLTLRTVTLDIVNSIMPTAPVLSGNLVCWIGTTGLLQDCGSGPTPNAITALTGDVTATGPGSAAATLATVNANVGSFGSATAAPVITLDGKGRATAASSVTVTPALGSITGLGAGVAGGLGGTATGTGGPVLTNTPTLITPNIGVATATSINGVTINNNAWTTYSPSVTSSTGTITTLGTVTGRSKTFGKTVFVEADVTITTAGTGAGLLQVTLPTAAAAFAYVGSAREVAVAGKSGAAYIAASATTMVASDASATTFIANGVRVIFTATYEIP